MDVDVELSARVGEEEGMGVGVRGIWSRGLDVDVRLSYLAFV